MISSALALSILSTSGFFAIFAKLPRKVRRFFKKHALLTDIIALVGIYYILGGTLTALFAASMSGLMVSGYLHIENNREKFLYLYDMIDAFKSKLADANDALNEYGATYRAKKEQLVDGNV